MMLLYGLILIPVNNQQETLLKGPDFISEMTEGNSSDLSSIHIYYSESESELKVLSKNEETNKQKKNQENQFYTVTSNSDFTTNRFTSKGVQNNLQICNSQADFNYVAHSYW